MRPSTWLSAAAAFGIAAALACGTSPSAPGAAALNLTGTWHGNGVDVQGSEELSLKITQSSGALAGTADMKPSNAADGSCASCHKFKSGTLSGTLTGTSLAMKVTFPAGGDGVPTPMCTIVFDVTAMGVSSDRVAATYSGDDSCEGSFTDGTLTIARQP